MKYEAVESGNIREKKVWGLNIDCPGCGEELTVDTAGGYRTFCQKCVDVFPPIPKGGNGYVISGRYPYFEWTD